MRFLLAVCVMSLVAFQPSSVQEPYPGQSHHDEPPAGWFCRAAAAGVPKDHACSCKRMAQGTPEDPQCCETEAGEDQACTVFCHKDHCRCPTVCQKPK